MITLFLFQADDGVDATLFDTECSKWHYIFTKVLKLTFMLLAHLDKISPHTFKNMISLNPIQYLS